MATDTPSPVTRGSLFATLPPEWPDPALEAELARAVEANGRKVVVLDDDPTGSQTMHDIDVLTTWPREQLSAALLGTDRSFYVLTNSRSLPAKEAIALNVQIASNLARAARETGVPFDLVSRSDSTLRGHYPAEIDALQTTLEHEFRDTREPAFDGHVLVPFFAEGGRYTIGNVHWVAEGEWLVPAGQTEYAQDRVFGYRSSDLRAWVAEKTGGRFSPEQVLSITIEDLRQGGPPRVAERLAAVSGGRPVVLNCAADSDLRVFVAGLLEAEAAGKRFLFRTGASFVRARSVLPGRPPVSADELGIDGTKTGGLVVVGSYIRKSGEQLQALLALEGATGIELDVNRVLDARAGGSGRAAEVERAGREAGRALAGGGTAVLYTSRAHVGGSSEAESLRISASISSALVETASLVDERPRFIVAKGGITSSDLATRALQVKRARVLGQIIPGVSVWRLGAESRYPGLPYVVFPGNVGGPDALAEVVRKLNRRG